MIMVTSFPVWVMLGIASLVPCEHMQTRVRCIISVGTYNLAGMGLAPIGANVRKEVRTNGGREAVGVVPCADPWEPIDQGHLRTVVPSAERSMGGQGRHKARPLRWRFMYM